MNHTSSLQALRPHFNPAPPRGFGFRPVWLRPTPPESVQKLSVLVASHLRPMKKTRRCYSADERQRALELVSGLGVSQASRRMGIAASTLRSWKRHRSEN